MSKGQRNPKKTCILGDLGVFQHSLPFTPLKAFAESFVFANSPVFNETRARLLYEEGKKGDVYFFRWDYKNKNWSSTDWEFMPPFLQVGMLLNEQIVYYEAAEK